jgi:hypothetical protein
MAALALKAQATVDFHARRIVKKGKFVIEVKAPDGTTAQFGGNRAELPFMVITHWNGLYSLQGFRTAAVSTLYGMPAYSFLVEVDRPSPGVWGDCVVCGGHVETERDGAGELVGFFASPHLRIGRRVNCTGAGKPAINLISSPARTRDGIRDEQERKAGLARAGDAYEKQKVMTPGI